MSEQAERFLAESAMGVPIPPPRNGLFQILTDGLPVTASMVLPSGRRSRGWTLRGDRINSSTARFDWIHATSAEGVAYQGSAIEREALRSDVLAAATRLVERHGFTVKPNGIGITIATKA